MTKFISYRGNASIVFLALLVVTGSTDAFGQRETRRRDTRREQPGNLSAQTLSQLREAAQTGDPESQFKLGYYLYQEASPDNRDYVEGLKWLRLAADQGHPAAQYWVGWSFHINKKHSEAATWWRRAAEQGHAVSQWRLGTYYHDGRGGLPKDLSEAALWYRRAVAGGNEDAKVQLTQVEHALANEQKPRRESRDVCPQQKKEANVAGGPSPHAVCQAIGIEWKERLMSPNARLALGLHQGVTNDTTLTATVVSDFRMQSCSRDKKISSRFACPVVFKLDAGDDPPFWFEAFIAGETRRILTLERAERRQWRIVEGDE